MIDSDLKFIDQTIQIIKAKDDLASFNIRGLHEFELVLFICLDLTRFELQINQKISDETASILSKLFAFQCFEYYYSDFPEIYSIASGLIIRFNSYNEKLKNHDLPFDKSTIHDWTKHLNQSISRYLK